MSDMYCYSYTADTQIILELVHFPDARNLLNADDATFAEREELEDIAAYMNTVPKKFRDKR